MTMTFPWKASLGSGGGVNRQGLAAVEGEDVDKDFFGRVVVNGFTGATVVDDCFGDVGDAGCNTGAAGGLGDAGAGFGTTCFGVEGAAATGFGEVGGEV